MKEPKHGPAENRSVNNLMRVCDGLADRVKEYFTAERPDLEHRKLASLRVDNARFRGALIDAVAELEMFRELYGKGLFSGTLARQRWDSAGYTIEKGKAALAERGSK